MTRKFTFGLALLALTLVVTGASFANNIPNAIVFGPGTTGTETVTTTLATLSMVSGPAKLNSSLGSFYVGGTAGVPTPGVFTATRTTGSSLTAPNSGELDVFIGTDVLTGVATLSLLSQSMFTVGSTTHQLDVYAGSYSVTGATSAFVSTGYRVGDLLPVDFSFLDGGLSSGELVPTVPEPGTIALVGSGLLACAGMLRRKL